MSFKKKGEVGFLGSWLELYWWLMRDQGFGVPSVIFDDFENQVREIQLYDYCMLRDAMRGQFILPKGIRSSFYGWESAVGSERKAHFEEFENTPNISSESQYVLGTREPLLEVFETDKIVSITVEIPGAFNEDIELDTTQNIVMIKVNNEKMNYYKKVELPCNVDVDSAIISYHNGILDIELKKVIVGRWDGIKAN